MIYGFVNGQALRMSQPVIASNTNDYLEIGFVFQSIDWSELTKWAHFKKVGDTNVYDIKLDADKVTKDKHLNLDAGTWEIYLHGNDVDGTERATTTIDHLVVEQTGFMCVPFPEIPPSAAEQIASDAEQAKKIAQSVRDDADAGKFAGKSPRIGENGNWEVWDSEKQMWVDTGVYSGGASPHIGGNGNWFVGTEDTGVKAQGPTGANGTNGSDGADGFSPVVKVQPIVGGNKVVITDATGDKSFDVKDGQKGDTGAKGDKGNTGETGEAGFSPTVQVTPTTGGHTVTITDSTGAKSFEVKDGAKGDKGNTGPAGKDGAQINDAKPSAETTYSSNKISQLITEKVDINDLTPATPDMTQQVGWDGKTKKLVTKPGEGGSGGGSDWEFIRTFTADADGGKQLGIILPKEYSEFRLSAYFPASGTSASPETLWLRGETNTYGLQNIGRFPSYPDTKAEGWAIEMQRMQINGKTYLGATASNKIFAGAYVGEAKALTPKVLAFTDRDAQDASTVLPDGHWTQIHFDRKAIPIGTTYTLWGKK